MRADRVEEEMTLKAMLTSTILIEDVEVMVPSAETSGMTGIILETIGTTRGMIEIAPQTADLSGKNLRELIPIIQMTGL